MTNKRTEMLWQEFKQRVHAKRLKKTGHNQHLRFSYFELSDLENIIYEVQQETGYSFGLVSQELYGNIMTFVYEFEGETVFKASYLHDSQQKNPVQSSGSTSTYGHRYSLMRLFGFAEPKDDPDNDTNNVKKPAKPAGLPVKAIKKALKKEKSEPQPNIVVEGEEEDYISGNEEPNDFVKANKQLWKTGGKLNGNKK